MGTGHYPFGSALPVKEKLTQAALRYGSAVGYVARTEKLPMSDPAFQQATNEMNAAYLDLMELISQVKE